MWQQTADRSAIIAITGIPGVGKTELAIQYGRSHLANYLGGVVWFSAADFGASIRDWMQRQFCPDQDLRRLEKLEQQVALGWDAWQDYCGSQRMALVMIDDVTDYHQQVAPYLPEVESDRSAFRFLLTGRSNLGKQIPTLELKELDCDAAVTMLARFAGTERIDADRATAKTLCNRLGYLPLAIALVGCWLSIDADRTLTDLIVSLERYGLDAPALERDHTTAKLTAERGLKAAFALSWAQLAEINVSAQQLARVLSLFAAVDLPWELVATVVQWYTQHYARPQPTVQHRSRSGQQNGLGRFWQQVWQWLCRLLGQRPRPSIPLPTPTPIPDLLEAKGALLRLNLMQRVDGKAQTYRLHSLLREFFQLQWQGADQEGWEIALSSVVCDYARSIPSNLSWEEAIAFDWLRPHLESARQILQDRMATAPDPETARRYKQQIGDIKIVVFRLSHPVLFETTFAQACQLHDQAKVDAAEGRTQESSQKFATALEDYRKAIAQARAAFPADSMQLAGYLQRLAGLFEELGNYRDGIPPAQEAVDIATTKASPLKLASYLHNLARLYRLQGRYAEAKPLFQQALALRQRLLGEEHLDVASSYNSLAFLYSSQGRYAEAEPLYQQALALQQRLFDKEHPDVASSYNNLALLYFSQGRYAEAKPLFQQALALRQRLLGKEHPDVASSYNNLAALYSSQDRYSEAEPLYQQALALQQRLFGEEHPDIATSYNNLAALYSLQGRYSEAEPLYQQALALRQRLFGEEHPDIATSYNNLAALYSSQGRYSEAEPLYQQALALMQRLFGEEHPDIATSYNNLAGLYRSQGRYAEAEPLYQQALALMQRLLGKEHPDVATSYNNLAGLYESQGRYAEAKPLYQQALALMQRLFGEEHPDVATSYNNLAGLYRSQGRYAEAEPLYIHALQLFQTRLGSEHPYIKGTFNNLIYLISQANQAGRANELSDHPKTREILQQIQAQDTENSDESATG